MGCAATPISEPAATEPSAISTAVATTTDRGATATSCATTTTNETATSTTTTTTAASTTASASTSSEPASTTTTAPPTTTVETTLADADPETLEIQEQLTALGYWLGPIDGISGSSTSHAVTAFQKVSGLAVSGEADAETAAALSVASRPLPHNPDQDGFEVDLTTQVGFVVANGEVLWVVDVSTGKSSTPTPAGDYAVYREIDGNRVSALGTLYRPKYFRGGYAIHGYPSVPAHAASHGCVRVTFAAMDMLWANDFLAIGTPVWVHN